VTDSHSLEPAQLRAWLLGAARREPAAFRLLYDATSPRLYGFALRILGKPELAEEALQDGFVAIWDHAGSSNTMRNYTYITLYREIIIC